MTSKAKKKEEQRHANKYESREGRRKLEENDGGMLHTKELDRHLNHQEQKGQEQGLLQLLLFYKQLTRNLKHIHIFDDEKQTLPRKTDRILKSKVRHRRSDLQGEGKEEHMHTSRTCK